MSERKRHRAVRSHTKPATSGSADSHRQLTEIREEVNDIVASARASLRDLGLDNAADFLRASRQSGGQ